MTAARLRNGRRQCLAKTSRIGIVRLFMSDDNGTRDLAALQALGEFYKDVSIIAIGGIADHDSKRENRIGRIVFIMLQSFGDLGSSRLGPFVKKILYSLWVFQQT